MQEEEILELRTQVQQFIRLFGLQESNRTPCGAPFSVSQVFALQELEATALTVVELAERLRLERSTVSRLVDGLVREGLVAREINPRNRREVHVSLTDHGRGRSEQIRQQSVRFYETMLAPIPASGQLGILESFRSLTASLSQMRSESHALDRSDSSNH